MAVIEGTDPDVLGLHHDEVDVRAPHGVGVIHRVALGIAPGRHQAAAGASAVHRDPRINQHGGVGDVRLGKVIQAPAQVNRSLPAARHLPETRDTQGGRVGLGIIEVGTLKTALHQIILFKGALQQWDFIGKVELLLRGGEADAGGQAVAIRVDPWFFPRGFHPRTDVCGIADPGFHGVLFARRDNALQRQHLGFPRLSKIRRHHHRTEPAGRRQAAV